MSFGVYDYDSTTNIISCDLFELDYGAIPSSNTITPYKEIRHQASFKPSLGGGACCSGHNDGICFTYFNSANDMGATAYSWDTGEVIDTKTLNVTSNSLYNMYLPYVKYNIERDKTIIDVTASGMAWNSSYLIGVTMKDGKIVLDKQGLSDKCNGAMSSSYSQANHTGWTRAPSSKFAHFKDIDTGSTWEFQTGSKSSKLWIEATHPFTENCLFMYSNTRFQLAKVDNASKSFTWSKTDITRNSTYEIFAFPYLSKSKPDWQFACVETGNSAQSVWGIYDAGTGTKKGSINLPIPTTAYYMDAWVGDEPDTEILLYSNKSVPYACKFRTDGSLNPVVWNVRLQTTLSPDKSVRPIVREVMIKK